MTAFNRIQRFGQSLSNFLKSKMVIVMKQNVATVNDIAGLFAGKLKNINRDKLLKEVKEELWGE